MCINDTLHGDYIVVFYACLVDRLGYTKEIKNTEGVVLYLKPEMLIHTSQFPAHHHDYQVYYHYNHNMFWSHDTSPWAYEAKINTTTNRALCFIYFDFV